MPVRPVRSPALLLGVALLLTSTSCKTPEQKMIEQVEKYREQGKYDAALGYLEKYLGKYSDSLAGWRYRVLLRLDQEKRPEAAGEYAALNEALSRHEPEILREVVLGAGGRWLVSDYASLARCGSGGIADAAFFTDVLTPKHLGEGSMTKVAVRSSEIAAVIDAMPGALDADATWDIVGKYVADPDSDLRARGVRAAGRHLAASGFSAEHATEATEAVARAAGESDEVLREAALLASGGLPAGPGREVVLAQMVDAFASVGDLGRATTLLLIGPTGDGVKGWSTERFESWAETASGPLRVFGVAGLAASSPNARRMKFLTKAADGSAAERMAAAAAHELLGDKASWKGPRDVWTAADVEDRRAWASVFVRSRGEDRAKWVMTLLSDDDALVTQAATAALAIPGVGADPVVDRALEQALSAADPATRAGAASAAVLRGSDGLSLAIQGVFSQGDDRVMNDVLQALVGTGNEGWTEVVALGLDSAVPTVRELAVDAAAATCAADNKELMESLLLDEDPHVAVRAASALYLLIGTATPSS